MFEEKNSRRQLLQKVAYTAPIIMTLSVMPAFAKTGSGPANCNNGVGNGPDDSSCPRGNLRRVNAEWDFQSMRYFIAEQRDRDSQPDHAFGAFFHWAEADDPRRKVYWSADLRAEIERLRAERQRTGRYEAALKRLSQMSG